MMLSIRAHYTAGDIAHIIERHRKLYEEEYGFNNEFGDYVAVSLSGKIERIWIAEQKGTFLGCIGLVESDNETAQLRWLFVEPEARGSGLGKNLMNVFLDHCRQKEYKKVFLWTVDKLSPARTLYERFGFVLSEEKPETTLWGERLREQRWDLSLQQEG